MLENNLYNKYCRWLTLSRYKGGTHMSLEVGLGWFVFSSNNNIWSLA